jgi:hypothetical protein
MKQTGLKVCGIKQLIVENLQNNAQLGDIQLVLVYPMFNIIMLNQYDNI